MKLIRPLHPEVKVIDEKAGVVDYVASDETLDSYREIIRANGWRFNRFERNSPFVDSHDYQTIERVLGKVVSFEVKNNQLVERVQWAIDVPEAKLAQFGWKMTLGGYVKAVSVGFTATRVATCYDSDLTLWNQQIDELKITNASNINRIFVEQEQVELSAVVIGANPNALAKAYKDGAIDEQDIDEFSKVWSERESAAASFESAVEVAARQRAREAFLEQLNRLIQ